MLEANLCYNTSIICREEQPSMPEHMRPTGDMESHSFMERIREATDRAREYLQERGITVSLSLPTDMKEPSPAQKKNLLEGMRAMGAALAGAAILAHAAPGEARVREFAPHEEKPEITQAQVEGLTFQMVEMFEGTSELRLEGPETSLPAKLPNVLEKTLPTTQGASGSDETERRHDSPFVLQEQRTEDRGGVPYRVGVYHTKDGVPLPGLMWLKVPYVAKKGADQPHFTIVTNDDKRFVFGQTDVAADLPMKNESPSSMGFYSEQSIRYPLSDDGKVSVGIGVAYGTEYGKPGTTVHTPGQVGGDTGHKVTPSLELTVTPDSLSEFTAKMQPRFVNMNLAGRRPLVIMGEWVGRTDNPNWQELKIDGALEVNGDQFMLSLPAPFSRAKGRIEATQAFINPAWGSGVTLSVVAEHVRTPESGATVQNPVHLGLRFGAAARIPENIKKNPSGMKWLVDLLGDKELDFGITWMPGMENDPTGAKVELDARLEKAKKQAKKEKVE